MSLDAATAEIQEASVADVIAANENIAAAAQTTLNPTAEINNACVAELGTKGCSPEAAQAAQNIMLSINVAQGANVTVNVNGADARMQAALSQFEAAHGQPATSGANLANLAARTNTGPTNGRG